MLHTQNCLQHHIKNAKATKFLLQSSFYTSRGRTCKVYLSTAFGLRLVRSSVAPTRSSTFYPYLIIKIGNRNLKMINILFSHIILSALKGMREGGGDGGAKTISVFYSVKVCTFSNVCENKWIYLRKPEYFIIYLIQWLPNDKKPL